MTALTFGNGQALTRSYDADYRTSAQTLTGLQALTYTVDPVGNCRLSKIFTGRDTISTSRDQKQQVTPMAWISHFDDRLPGDSGTITPNSRGRG